MRRESLLAGLDAIADVLIPPSGDWPAPSQLRLAEDLAARLRDREAELIGTAVDAVGGPDGFAALPEDAKAQRLAALEADDPGLFDVVRRCVYYAYYAQPTVVRVLQRKGYDVGESPQPRGYRMDPFTTDAIRGVDRARTVWIPAERVGTTLKTAS